MTDDELNKSLERLIRNARLQGFLLAIGSISLGYFIGNILRIFK